ncbi:MAG: OFA family MFS transporter [Spirochaetes bacterium]|nr:OFA family MFS transporter [Spirochaetota bacterium]
MSELPHRVYRMLPLIGGVLGSTTCGALLYAWTVFIPPLTREFGWNQADIALAFAIACLFFGLMAFPAGILNDRFGPRNVVMCGAVILGAGFISSGFINYKWQLYISYGVIAGLGGGFIYLPPIATAPKWWPNNPGLATGFSVVGMGLGPFLMAPIASYIIANYSWRDVFIYAGVVLATVAFFSSFCLKNPSCDWNMEKQTNVKGVLPIRSYSLGEAVRVKQFWLLWAVYFLGSFSGLMVIDYIAGDEVEKCFFSWLAIANAISRILIGSIADKFGTRPVLSFVFAFQILSIMLFIPFREINWAFCILSALIGWNYGSMFTLFPTICMNHFGVKEHGSNYGLLFTSWGVAAFSGRFLGSFLWDVNNSHLIPFLVAVLMVIIALVINGFVKSVQD